MIVLCLSLFLGAGASSMIDFEIADQFDRPHSAADMRGKVVLLVGSDRKGSRYQGAWVQALRAEAVPIVEVADLRGVPFFIKGSVKRKFPEDRSQWVLMDWKGTFAKSYGFERDACTILLFDRNGVLRSQDAVHELDEAVLERILQRIAALRTAD
jgi:hypothetical protein